MIPVWTLDFETLPIGPRPNHYPPAPVGLAYRAPDGIRGYLSWGHPDGNNCDRSDAVRFLRDVWNTGLPVLFHNAKFDMAVACEKLGLPWLPWDRVHDTMFLAFLVNPYSRTLGLKQLAETWLGMPPGERDAVAEWVLAHKADLPRFPWIKNSKGEPNAAPTKRTAGAWTAFAPPDLVGPYAIGDVDRTWRLFQALHPIVQQAGMGPAYDVERELMPHLAENERQGLRVDQPQLEADVALYRQAFDYAEDWLRWRLNSQGLNFDADQDVADALERTGIVTEFAKTKTGKRSVAKDSLHPDKFTDPQVASVLGYRNRLKTCLSMFMAPWLAQAQEWGGRIGTNWNQVSNPDGGTRTGRPSTRDHNLLNISKSFEGQNDGYAHPAFLSLPELPLVRKYILPEEGHVLNGRDFKGQELRVFAHFAQGDLLRQYQQDPDLDVHTYVGGRLADVTHDEYWRSKEARSKRVKTLNFQAIYGGGIPAAQAKLRCSYEEAARFKALHDTALPDRRILADQLSAIVRSGLAVRTLGGRLYVRPPFKKQKNGRTGDADYILINYLVQGSSADATKRALLNLLRDPTCTSRFLLNVYDELVISSPIEVADAQSLVLKRAMEGVPLRVPLLTDAEQGMTWGAMQERPDL